MNQFNKISPFQPEEPVEPEKFEGRKNIIEKNLPFLNQAANGIPTHFFIKGKRGMGKTSLASYFKDIAERKYKMVGVHVLNDGVHDIDSLIKQIIERLLNEIEKETWSDKIKEKLKDHIKTVQILGNKIEFNPDKRTTSHIKDNFPFFLKDLVENFDDKKGLFIIIDDINGLSETPDFANWYKSFADTLSTRFRGELPIAFILTTYPENAQKLYDHNYSFNRQFKHIDIEGLENNEIRDFFIKSFGSLNIDIEKEAMDLMVSFSSGLPNMMQEIGDGVFWINNDFVINKEIALKGIIRAGGEIGIKYLQPALDNSIRSERYLTIFRELGNDFTSSDLTKEYTFRKRDFASKLNTKEQNAFGDFLSRAKELKIIEYAAAPNTGVYKFTNNLYPIYFFIQYIDYQNKN
ncbi:ATP-binding protein [Methanobrevibacter sp.]|uniref:ATP-binding protein n=1 Tax=Methanobrevibacter sp. TaxID=66852 RepID=UPI00261020BF|nr:ATP-binding protein [uncultured Methanobrevibacter sp.]